MYDALRSPWASFIHNHTCPYKCHRLYRCHQARESSLFSVSDFTLLIYGMLDLSFLRRGPWILLSSRMGRSAETQGERERERERSVLFINSLKWYCCVSSVVAEYNRNNERCWNDKEGGNRSTSPTAILWNTNPTKTLGSNLSLRSDRPATKQTTFRGGKVTIQCSLIDICRRLGGTSVFSLHDVAYHKTLIYEYYW